MPGLSLVQHSRLADQIVAVGPGLAPRIDVLASLRTAAIFGIDVTLVRVEADVTSGLPGFTMVGLPDASVRESRDRVRAAIRNAGFPFPAQRVTVNLAPGDVRKIGASFDLPIALGVLAAMGVVEHRDIASTIIFGALSLDGSVQPVPGVLPVAAAARRLGTSDLVIPASNAAEAAVGGGLRIAAVPSLREAVHALNHPEQIASVAPPAP